MLYSKLNKDSRITSDLIVDKQIILHFIPDINSSILDFIDNMNINLNNLQGILIKSEMIKLSSSFVNTRNYLGQLKSGIQDHRNITVYNITPSDIQKNKFIIYDHSPMVNLISMYNDINVKQSTEFLIQHLKDTNTDLKLKFPSYENVPVFYLNKANGLLSNLKYMKRTKDLNFFDKLSFISVDDLILNFAYYNSKGEREINLINLSNSESKLKKVKLDLTPVIKTNITKKIEVTANAELDKLDVNIDKLSSSLNSMNITDKTVMSNFKEAINKKINSSTSNTDELSDEDIGYEILKASHKVIFNNSNVKELYKHNPTKLFDKLKDVNHYKETLSFPKSSHIRLSNPEDLIKIRDITGPVRHKYEFNENIDFNVEKLFKVLENKHNPIQVINITKDLKDNDLERYYEYSITLKNATDKGVQGTYDIKLKLPSLINGKYFKLNGKEYIISSQQFLNPITKDKPGEVRFLTHYSMIRLRLKNLLYTPSEIGSLLTLISNKYSKHVDTYEKGHIKFKNGEEINLNDENHIYFNPNTNIKLVLKNGKYFVGTTEVLRNEYLFDRLHGIIPELNLKIANKSVQYIQCYVVGAWVPLIVYFWQQLGLIESLLRFNLDYSFGTEPNKEFNKTLRFELADTSLFIYPENKREEYIANGLYILTHYLKNIKQEELSSRDSCYDYIYTEHGGSIIEKFDGAAENMIDPITKDLLEFEDQPNNLLDNLSGPCVDKLINSETDHPSDLKSLRSRQSEYLMHLLYNEIDNYSLYS